MYSTRVHHYLCVRRRGVELGGVEVVLPGFLLRNDVFAGGCDHGNTAVATGHGRDKRSPITAMRAQRPGEANHQHVLGRVTTAVAVVACVTQFPSSDRMQVLPESTVSGKNLRQPDRKGPILPPRPQKDDRLESLHGSKVST